MRCDPAAVSEGIDVSAEEMQVSLSSVARKIFLSLTIDISVCKQWPQSFDWCSSFLH